MFGASYVVVYKFVAKLHLGLRSRWAFLADTAGFGGEFRSEHRLITGSWHVPLERDILDINALENFIGVQIQLLQEHARLVGFRDSKVSTADSLLAEFREDLDDLQALPVAYTAETFHAKIARIAREEAERKRVFMDNVDYAGF